MFMRRTFYNLNEGYWVDLFPNITFRVHKNKSPL